MKEIAFWPGGLFPGRPAPVPAILPVLAAPLMEYFKKLQHLLDLEREADRDTYRQLAATTTAARRREDGLTWYPVAIRGTETGARLLILHFF